MQNVDPSPDMETTTLSPTTATPVRERLEALALELAQTLEPSPRPASRSPIQARLKGLENFIRSAYHYFEEANQKKVSLSGNLGERSTYGGQAKSL